MSLQENTLSMPSQLDFRLKGSDSHGLEVFVALFGIESRGLTLSLAIGETVAPRLSGDADPD